VINILKYFSVSLTWDTLLTNLHLILYIAIKRIKKWNLVSIFFLLWRLTCLHYNIIKPNLITMHLLKTMTVGPQFIYSVLKCDNQSQPDKSAGSLGVNALIRAGIGYNSRKAYVGAFFICEYLANTTAINNATTLMSIGIFKLNFVYRFTLNKPIKFLNPTTGNFFSQKKIEANHYLLITTSDKFKYMIDIYLTIVIVLIFLEY